MLDLITLCQLFFQCKTTLKKWWVLRNCYKFHISTKQVVVPHLSGSNVGTQLTILDN